MACKSKNENEVAQHKVENLIKLAEIYGIVKYFHPSDEAYNLDWDKFAIYSAEEILKCENQEQFAQKIDSLFRPIIPTLNSNTPLEKKGLSEIFWYHQGVGFGMKNKNGPYFSKRFKVNETNDTIPYRPHYGDTINIELEKEKVFSIPVVLLENENGTQPKSSLKSIESLNSKLENHEVDESGLAFRMGNVISTYNVFQHFFPYFDVLGIDWQKELRSAIVQSFDDSSKTEHIITLRKFTAPLKDGHISVNTIGEKKGNYYPPISWEWIQNKLTITHIWDNSLKLKVGDEVTKINGQDSKEYFDEIESRISAGTKGWLRHKSEIESLRGQKNLKFTIEVNGKEIELTRGMHVYDQNKGFNPYERFENNIHYLNLTLLDWETIEYLLPDLEESNGIICDLRGYPNGQQKFINHLLKKADTAKGWLRIPKIVLPNQKNITDFVEGDWNEMMIPAQPYLGDKIIVFITDGSAISYAESIMGFVKGYNLATIVGQPTAGTNGNFNTFTLPGDIEINWTGMQVLKLDGTPLHGIGILPDVYMEKTVEGIINGKDEFLDKALELVNEKISAANTVYN
ncbi:S41 family peptidase [Flagellimonas sediminis]|nr:S41 family peptidase [Allomuricauda sediminis]